MRKGNAVTVTENGKVEFGKVVKMAKPNVFVKNHKGKTFIAKIGDTTVISASELAKLVELEVVDTSTSTSAKETKKSKTIEIFQRLTGSKRSIVIKSLIEEVGLSSAGASTYYQNCKSGAWC